MVKTEIKSRKGKRARKFIKDKATVDFLLQHLEPSKIDFSKIKIPSFLNFEDEEKNKSNPAEETKKIDSKNSNEMPIFGMSLLRIF